MAAGLRPDPLGELKRSPRPLAAIRGLLLKGREGKGEEGKGGEGKRGEGEGEEGNLLQGVRGIDAPVFICLQ